MSYSGKKSLRNKLGHVEGFIPSINDLVVLGHDEAPAATWIGLGAAPAASPATAFLLLGSTIVLDRTGL